jgi:CRP-like cAMP-binding protein
LNKDAITNILVKLKERTHDPLIAVLQNYANKQNLYFVDNFCKFKWVRTMNQGLSFGEYALTLSKPRIATCVAKTPLYLASLNKEDYHKIFEQQINEMNRKMKCFNSQFGFLSKDAVIRFSYDFKEMKITNQQYVFKQGEKANAIYLLKSGSVKLLINHPDKKKKVFQK